MNERKMHVMNTAHQLFMEKGYQSTSIQDILTYSGIAKGTFYNYFSSKNELLIALLTTLYQRIEKERDELLIGQDPANIEIFIKQLEFEMEMNRTNGLYKLFEEVIYLNDEAIKKIIKTRSLRFLQWVFQRFTEIYGEEKRPYLLDCAIIFIGMLNSHIRYYTMVYGSTWNIPGAVRYSVERISKVIEETAAAQAQLMDPDYFEQWLPHYDKKNKTFQQKLRQHVLLLKKSLKKDRNKEKWTELLDFIQEELLHTKKPRKFLIESAFSALAEAKNTLAAEELQNLKRLADSYILQLEMLEKRE